MQSSKDLLRLLWDGAALDRASLSARTGMGRTAVSAAVGSLLDAGLVEEVGTGRSTGGRPPQLLKLNARHGVVLAADLGATHANLMATDLAGVSLSEGEWPLDIGDGPRQVIGWVVERFLELLEDCGYADNDVFGVAIGVPGPVEFAAAQAVAPPIMPGWDQVPIRPLVQERFDCPVVLDNDVNIMGFGEYWSHWRHRIDNLLFVKVGTGIGGGVIANGQIYRGSQGAAGDIGHVALPDHLDIVCHCGNRGCLESVAGGLAIANRVAPGLSVRDLLQQAHAGAPAVIPVLREAGRTIGQVLAGAINLLNPGVLAVGGGIGVVGDHLIAGIREVVFQRSTVLASRDLQLVPARLGSRAGVVGAATLATTAAFEAPRLGALLEATA